MALVLEGTLENHNDSQESRRPRRDWKPGPPEYE